MHLERIIPRLSTVFLSSTSPFLERGPADQPLVSDRAPAADTGGEPVQFTPDGVFTLIDQENGETLLFFLEVDMATETLASSRVNAKDIRNKVINYQQYFRSGGYKRYEELWKCELNGFRLLFLAHTPARLAALCRLVIGTPPSDFVWLTDRIYASEAYNGPPSDKQFETLHRRIQDLYQQQREERVNMWRDVSRLRLGLPETIQQYLGAHRKLGLLNDPLGDVP